MLIFYSIFCGILSYVSANLLVVVGISIDWVKVRSPPQHRLRAKTTPFTQVFLITQIIRIFIFSAWHLSGSSPLALQSVFYIEHIFHLNMELKFSLPSSSKLTVFLRTLFITSQSIFPTFSFSSTAFFVISAATNSSSFKFNHFIFF